MQHENKTHPYIWGKGWYAIYESDEDCWYLSPIDYFNKTGFCPDGWDWDIPEGMDDDALDDFIYEHGCEPNVPEGFSYCVESGISCYTDLSVEDQKKVLKEFGFTVDNIPKWGYDR